MDKINQEPDDDDDDVMYDNNDVRVATNQIQSSVVRYPTLR